MFSFLLPTVFMLPLEKGLKLMVKKRHTEDIQIEHVVTEWNSFQFQRNR